MEGSWGVPPATLPALRVSTSACESEQPDQQGEQQGVEQGGEQGVEQGGDWLTGMALPAEVGRCQSSLSNYSGHSTPWSSYRRRPGSSLSSSAAQQQQGGSPVSSSQQMHELRLAAMQGKPQAVARLLDAGLAVDQTLRQGWTALMYAASAAQVPVLRLLLQRKADPNKHKELFTPLMAACASSVKDNNNNNSSIIGSSDVVTNGADSTTTAAVGNVTTIKDSSDVVTKTEGDDSSGSASERRVLACVELLLSHGASVNAAERHRLTPLMFASKEGRLLVVRTLLRAGALPNMQDNKGWSALCWACHGGHGACVRELLHAAADASTSTAHGQTAADIARAQHYFKLAEVVEAAALGSPITAPSLSSPSLSVPSPPPSTCSDLDMVLAGLDLSHLSATFARHKVDLVGFLRLTSGELCSLGISEVGVQHKLMTAIAEMHRKAWQPSSMAPLTTTPYISLLDATSMLGNVNKHVTFLEATLAFLREQLETSPGSHHLHHNTTDTTISTLITAAEDAALSINRLHSTTLFLSNHLRKLSECSAHLPSDLIVCSGRDEPRVWNRAACCAAAATAVLLTAVWWLKPPLLIGLFAMAPQGDSVLLDCN